MRFIDFLPDVSFLRVSTGKPDQDLAYTLVRNKTHSNVAFMLDEEKRREPDKDTLTVYRGLLGSYPNFMFNVPLDRIGAFSAALHAVRSREQFTGGGQQLRPVQNPSADLDSLSLVCRLHAQAQSRLKRGYMT